MLKIGTAVVLMSLVLPAAAQEASPGLGHGEGCKAKMEALCPGVQPGGGRLMACLKQQGKTFAEVCPEEAARQKAKRQQQQQQSSGALPSVQPSGTPQDAPPSGGTPGGFPSQAPTAQNPGSSDQ